MGEDANRVLRGLLEKVGGTGEIPRRLEQHSQVGGHRRALLPVMSQERLRHRRAPRGPPRRLERGVQGILIKHVDEAVADGQRPIGKLLFPHRSYQEVHPIASAVVSADGKSFSGSGTYTASNGDQLFFTYETNLDYALGTHWPNTGRGHADITGGTGRFEGASGSGDYTGGINEDLTFFFTSPEGHVDWYSAAR